MSYSLSSSFMRTTSTFTFARRAAIAPKAASTGATIVKAPPTITPAVKGISMRRSPLELRIISRRTLPSLTNSFTRSTSSLPAISISSIQVRSSFLLLLFIFFPFLFFDFYIDSLASIKSKRARILVVNELNSFILEAEVKISTS